jgi:hypothetical protein
VETAFLHGENQEKSYINIPEGMSYVSKNCLLLTKTFYGLVKSASEFHKNFISNLKRFGFKKNKSDLCLALKWTRDGVLIIGIYVDNRLMIGKRDGIADC